MKKSEFTKKLTNAFQRCPYIVEWNESDDSSNSTLHYRIKYIDGYFWDIYLCDFREVNNTLSFFMFTGVQEDYNDIKNDRDSWDIVNLTNNYDFVNMFNGVLGDIHTDTLTDMLFCYGDLIDFATLDSDDYDSFTIDYQGYKYKVETVFKKNTGSIEKPELHYDFVITGKQSSFVVKDKAVVLAGDLYVIYCSIMVTIMSWVYRDKNDFQYKNYNTPIKTPNSPAFWNSLSKLNNITKRVNLELINLNTEITYIRNNPEFPIGYQYYWLNEQIIRNLGCLRR